jgi:Amidase
MSWNSVEAMMSDELTWASAWRIKEMITKREVSPVEVTEHFLGRIEEHDTKLKSFAYLDRKGAREQAARAEKAVVDGDHVGLLHGIPVSVKRHFYVKGMPVYDMGTQQDLPKRTPTPLAVLKRLCGAGSDGSGVGAELPVPPVSADVGPIETRNAPEPPRRGRERWPGGAVRNWPNALLCGIGRGGIMAGSRRPGGGRS